FETNVAQSAKNYSKVMQYAVQGGNVYHAAQKQEKPATGDKSDEQEGDAAAAKNSYSFLEAAAFNAIANESEPKARMDEIEHFNAAFPGSQFSDQVATYAMSSLEQMNDKAGLLNYGEKILASDPNN